jgi:hypothetical protein
VREGRYGPPQVFLRRVLESIRDRANVRKSPEDTRELDDTLASISFHRGISGYFLQKLSMRVRGGMLICVSLHDVARRAVSGFGGDIDNHA